MFSIPVILMRVNRRTKSLTKARPSFIITRSLNGPVPAINSKISPHTGMKNH